MNVTLDVVFSIGKKSSWEREKEKGLEKRLVECHWVGGGEHWMLVLY